NGLRFGDRGPWRLTFATHRHCMGTACLETATRRWIDKTRHAAVDKAHRAARASLICYRSDETSSVGMPTVAEERKDVRLLHNTAGIDDINSVAHMGN